MSDPSARQAVVELSRLLHSVGAGCSDLCRSSSTLIEYVHEAHAQRIFDTEWRPVWWFHNPDGTPSGRSAVPYNVEEL